ncbi:MAG: PIN domain-containing protein [Ruminococcus sp.]|jgi:predicted nucleic acid-binding protein|nr:PIN domain-containing protein [Ruminococcus sp.]
MVVLIDTDVLMDYAQRREPFYENAAKIIEYKHRHRFIGIITTQCVANMFYLLSKDKKKIDYPKNIRNTLLGLCYLFRVSEVESGMTIRALDEPQYKDFEDRLQMLCAVKENAEFIVTRNLKDYTASEVKGVSPEEFLKLIESE